MAETHQELRDEINRLSSMVYVPGRWRCPKCAVELNAAVLTSDGAKADSSSQRCPNHCGPMWRVTFKDEAKRFEDLLIDVSDKLKTADAMLTAPEQEISGKLNALNARLEKANDRFNQVHAMNQELARKVGGLTTCVVSMFAVAAKIDPSIKAMIDQVMQDKQGA